MCIKERGNGAVMEKDMKKEKLERAAEKFVLLREADKSFIVGYMTGIQEERARQERGAEGQATRKEG